MRTAADDGIVVGSGAEYCEGKRAYETMTKPMTAVLADALQLDEKARAALASELLASLDGPADADAARAWEEEIARRIAAIEAGTVELEPSDDIRHRIEKDILGR